MPSSGDYRLGQPLDILIRRLGQQISGPELQNHISDVLVVEFDRALFHGPKPNLELVDSESSNVLEHKLGDASWWNLPAVLEAASEHCGWTEPVVDVLRKGVAAPSVFTVVVSGRSAQNESVIREMLAARGIHDVDMIVLGESKRGAHPKKLCLLEGLWRHFHQAETMTVYEGRQRDCKIISRLLNDLALSPWGRTGAFMFQPVVAPLSLLPPLVERQLIEQMVAEAPVRPHCASVSLEWSHRISLNSRILLCRWVDGLVASHAAMVRAFWAKDISICKGPLPISLLSKVGMNDPPMTWRLSAWTYHNGRLIGYATPDQTVPTSEKTEYGVPVELARVQFTQPPSEQSVVTLNEGPVFSTFVYEVRKLSVRIPRPH